MKITVLGAAGGEVTGSSYLVETSRARLLVDCGLFQGGRKVDALNRSPLGAVVMPLDAVLVTHAHLDHTGRLPLLAQAGYAGPLFATPATIEMTGLILRDSAKIQTQDAERANRHLPAGAAPVVPLYTIGDAEKLLRNFKPVPYRDAVAVAPGVQARFIEAGHMLGSASIQLIVEDDGVQRTVVFSGDLGPRGAPILRDSEPFAEADLVFLESTYGDRDHQPFAATVAEFTAALQLAVTHRSKVLVPTFAVGRAQLLTALLAGIFRQKLLPPFPVFLDSPMAIEASHIYDRHPELFDEEMTAFLKERPIARDLATMRWTATAEESKQINAVPGPCLVMAPSGMCNAGRILHHLRHNVGNPATQVLIVGFQGRGTIGRQLVDGANEIFLFGERIAVRARVHTLGGFSAHAGQTDLMKWFAPLASSKPRVVLTHGEDGPRQALAGVLAARHGLTAVLPALGESITL
ncbi:MAG: MBL fold metallo-hydrolase [Opitutus sp.]|nr:MBL fold metallo-hydrolase [Opitutus sp.]